MLNGVIKKQGKTRDGRDVYRVRIQPGLDPHTKKRISISTTVYGTHDDAKEKLAEMLRLYRDGHTFKAKKVTLNEFLEEWLVKACAHRLKPRTIQDYRDIIRSKIQETIGKKRISEITPAHVDEFYRQLSDSGLASQSVRNVHTVLRGAFRQATAWDVIRRNPTSDAILPRKRERKLDAEEDDLSEVAAFNESQLRRFRLALPGVRWSIVLLFALVTGARPSEYLALQWSDIDWELQHVRVTKTLFRPRGRGKGWVFETTKTAKSRRLIPLPSEMMALLREHQQSQEREKVLMGDAWDHAHDFVFTNENGGPIEAKNLLNRAFKVALDKALLSKKAILNKWREQQLEARPELLENAQRQILAEKQALSEDAFARRLATGGKPKKRPAKLKARDLATARALALSLIPEPTTEQARRTLREAGYTRDFCLYSLRHSCATMMLLAGVPAKTTSDRLGHSSTNLTLDTYSHVLPSMQRSATDLLASKIFG